MLHDFIPTALITLSVSTVCHKVNCLGPDFSICIPRKSPTSPLSLSSNVCRCSSLAIPKLGIRDSIASLLGQAMIVSST